MTEFIKTDREIRILRDGGYRLAEILQKVIAAAKPGISTWELDKLAEGLILVSGGRPSFKGHQSGSEKKPFPAVLCTSINDELVHGIPKQEKVLQGGDVVGLDVGMQWPTAKTQNIKHKTRGGLYTDMAVTVGVGKVSEEAERLMRVTKESLAIGIKAVRPGARLGDIGFVIQEHLEKNKLGVIRNLAGHGVGYAVHEEPLVPNFGERGTGLELKKGMVLAIEPMATLGDWHIKLAPDGSTYKTADGSLGAHFEHTIAVTADGAEILTIP